jgi:hypothetical protein
VEEIKEEEEGSFFALANKHDMWSKGLRFNSPPPKNVPLVFVQKERNLMSPRELSRRVSINKQRKEEE